MAWNTPVTNYLPSNKVPVSIFNNIGHNFMYLKERADSVDQNINQGVKTTDSPTFVNMTASTVDTGNGASKCFPMDQPTRTTDILTFGGLKVGSDGSTISSIKWIS